MTKQQFHALPNGLQDAVEFESEKMPKVDAITTTIQQKRTWGDEAYAFFQKVRDLGLGPLAVRLVFGEPGGDGVCCETRGPGALEERGATAIAIATAFALRRGGFDDVRVAVSNERRDGVTLRFTNNNNDDEGVEIVEYHASPVR